MEHACQGPPEPLLAAAADVAAVVVAAAADSQRPAGGTASAVATIELLDSGVAQCCLCRLSDTRIRPISGRQSGSADRTCRVMVVVDAPTYGDEQAEQVCADDQGADVLRRFLNAARLADEQVRITSVVRCRPPRGRTPLPDEVETCEGWLFREIELIQPTHVLAMGSVAARTLTGRPVRLFTDHGVPFDGTIAGRPVTIVPLFSPAVAATHPLLGQVLLEDAARLAELLTRAQNEVGTNDGGMDGGGDLGHSGLVGDTNEQSDGAGPTTAQMTFELTASADAGE